MNSDRSFGSAHAGTVEWMLQRLTALYLALFLLFLGIRLVFVPPRNYEQWRALWSGNLIRVSTLVFTLGLLGHAWIGLRSVFRDYIRSVAVRLLVELTVGCGLVSQALWAFGILWR
ncbi:MAG: succinate dehydrogenase, hydrophobic membrane anchor protein [Acidiferrobacteraceae bacterium]